MPAKMLRMIAVAAACLCDGTFAAAAEQPRHARASAQGSAGSSQHAARTQAAGRDSHVDPAAPYKANRLSSPRASEPILNIPGQTTVLTRDVLDDMKATSVKDALRSTAGVTIGR